MPTFIGKPVTVAEDKQLQVGDTLRDFNLTATDLTKKSLSEFDGKKKVISIVPSIDTMYVAEVESFTHKCKNHVIVAQKFLSPEDHVLLIDDFLANGCALQGLIQIVQSAGATVEGIGIAVEKGFQSGGRMIRNLGFQLESLAIVDGMDAATGEITFREQPQWDAK